MRRLKFIFLINPFFLLDRLIRIVFDVVILLRQCAHCINFPEICWWSVSTVGRLELILLCYCTTFFPFNRLVRIVRNAGLIVSKFASVNVSKISGWSVSSSWSVNFHFNRLELEAVHAVWGRTELREFRRFAFLTLVRLFLFSQRTLRSFLILW